MNANWTRNLVIESADGKTRMGRRVARRQQEQVESDRRDERSNAIAAARDFARFDRMDLAERCIHRSHITVTEFIGLDRRQWTHVRFFTAQRLYGRVVVADWTKAHGIVVKWPEDDSPHAPFSTENGG